MCRRINITNTKNTYKYKINKNSEWKKYIKFNNNTFNLIWIEFVIKAPKVVCEFNMLDDIHLTIFLFKKMEEINIAVCDATLASKA